MKESLKFENWHIEKVAADKLYYKAMQKSVNESKEETAVEITRKELPFLDFPERKKIDFKNKTFYQAVLNELKTSQIIERTYPSKTILL
jgi:hypothetical protein